ncbi:hypothetical protein M0802_011751 [Mischocyttarus mexicanus]|nr:hypothetical protein M0802_011751 [Mischocyttarus mexicanus]
MDWSDGKKKYGASVTRNRESTDEIAKLEAELRRAYWRKELMVQVASEEAEKNMKLIKDRLELEKNFMRVLIKSEKEDRTEIQKKAEAREEAARDIAERLARKAKERAKQTEEGLREREYYEKLEQSMEEQENLKILQKKLKLKREMMEEKRILSELTEIQFSFQKAEEENLEREREIYSREIERRANEARSRRAKQEKRRERVFTSLLAIILQEDSNEREKKQLLKELVYEELELERVINEWKERNIKSRMSAVLMDSLKEQISLTELCKASFLQRDLEFADETSRRLAEDEKTLRLTADAKKRAMLRYRQDLEKMIIERRRIRDEEISRIQEEAEKERRLEILRKENAKKERESLLLEHASNVGEFLNQGVLTEEERRILYQLSLSSKNETETEEDDNSKIYKISDS